MFYFLPVDAKKEAILFVFLLLDLLFGGPDNLRLLWPLDELIWFL